ncbi:MAG: endonuclease/exonuclease/phosphatase family protein [Propionibacteriaceae bacterium]|nr:endonuclease/exonuclease/phosphatase family protein [Propionibacteriaceae bacterium]
MALRQGLGTLAALCLLTACVPTMAVSPIPSAITDPEVTQTAPEAESDEPVTFTAMSYNILGGYGPAAGFYSDYIDLDELVPVNRVPATIDKIRLGDPDVIGFQEFQWDDEGGPLLRSELDDYTWVRLGYDLAIALRTSRFEVLSTGQDVISDGEARGWGFSREAVWAEVWAKAEKRRFFVFNTHLQPWQTEENAEVRNEEATNLLAMIERVADSAPFILLGDFNLRSDEKRAVFVDPLNTLLDGGLVDSFTVAKKDVSDVPNAASMNQMGAKVGGTKVIAKVIKRFKSSRHYDYVWVKKGTKVATWATISGPNVKWKKVNGQRVPTWTGIVASDHSPVQAKLTLK